MFPPSHRTRIAIAAVFAALAVAGASVTPVLAQQPATVKPGSQPAPKSGSTPPATVKPATVKPSMQPPVAKPTPAVAAKAAP
ncbi:MAG: transcriptional regulator, partial [Gemmatimonadaceae bacterium]